MSTYGSFAAVEMGTEKMPEIEVAMRELDKEIEQLLTNIEGLEVRLSCVLSPLDTVKNSGQVGQVGQPKALRSALYEWLDGVRSKIAAANGRIREINNRLEL